MKNFSVYCMIGLLMCLFFLPAQGKNIAGLMRGDVSTKSKSGPCIFYNDSRESVWISFTDKVGKKISKEEVIAGGRRIEVYTPLMVSMFDPQKMYTAVYDPLKQDFRVTQCPPSGEIVYTQARSAQMFNNSFPQ